MDFDVLQKRILQNAPFEKCNGTIEFSEGEQNMVLNMTLPREFWCVKNLDDKFKTLKNTLRKPKCADATIWAFANSTHDSKRLVLHIIEMKKTVTKSGEKSGWEYIKCQFVGAYRLCRMVAAALDIEFEQVIFYTAFVNDDDIASQSADFSDTDDTEDPSIILPDRDMADDIPFPSIEWASGKCRLDDSGWSNNYTDKEHTHIRIKLEELPDGTFVSTYPCCQT